PARFWQMHVQAPGGYDVMGVGIAGTPIPTLGFNRDVAWTHTVTAARHFTVYALTLSPESSTTYMLDGEPVEMESRFISVPMPDDAEPVYRQMYYTKFGPVVTVPGSGVQWSKQFAFALRDANSGNQRAIDAWLKIGQAGNVAEIEAAVSETLGIPWVNTIAADRDGNALHADVTAVPNVTAELIANCSTPFSALVASQVTLLDGSRTECDWNTASEDGKSGLLPASEQASRTRRDYVTNSNDSYWISNPRNPWKELSPILGEHAKALSLRTRSNFTETEGALAAGKMDHAAAQALVFGNKSLAADMVVDAVNEQCFKFHVVAKACVVLDEWDGRFEADSKGAYLFVTFWEKVRRRDDLWSVPFDPANPIETPRDLVTDNLLPMTLREKLLEAAAEIEADGIALDAPWGEVQVRLDGDDRIAVHGGPGTAGVLNMQRSRKIAGGITPVHGSSYIQIIGFDEDGPVADAILSYSQSTDPASPHYADQTRLYSEKHWQRLPFSNAEIEAARISEPLQISE
ncbi:MAG: penicillin acylase family protein, partial [Erythrobacter sp.]